MEKGSSSQQNITPELPKALAEQLLGASQTTTKPTITIGPYKLNPFPKDSPKSFKTTKTVSEMEQCIIDYLWNAKNKAQMTMSLQALAWYFNHKATTTTTVHKPLSINADSDITMKLEPQATTLHYKKLERQNKEMEEDLKIVEEKIKDYEEMVGNYKRLQDYVRQKELEETLECWKRFPHYYNPEREKLLDTIFAEKMSHQTHLQKILRTLCRTTTALLPGISYKVTTFKNDPGFQGCSFVSCSLDLRSFKDIRFEGADLSLDGLLKEGAVHQIIITKKEQLRFINNERLLTTLRVILEKEEQQQLCIKIKSIPPSYFTGNLDEARSIIFIDTILSATIMHKHIQEEDLVSDEAVDLLDQINYYRAIVFQRPVDTDDYFLIAANHTMSLYARREYTIPFANQLTEHAEQMLYFKKLGISHYPIESGDTTEAQSLSSASFSETTEANIANAMEA